MSKFSITPEAAKLELHAYGQVYNVTNTIKNWKHIEVELTRDQTSSTFSQISFNFEFVLDGYDIVKSIFDKYMYRAKAELYIYQRKDNWPYESDPYEQPEVFHVDWTSYEETPTVIKVSTESWLLWDILRARRKLNYDIPVEEIKAPYLWNFQRINLENTLVEYSHSEMNVAKTSFTRTGFGITYKNAEISVPDKIIYQTVADGTDIGDGGSGWFLQTAESLQQNVELSIEGELKIPSLAIRKESEDGALISVARIGFYKKNAGKNLTGASFLEGFDLEINPDGQVFMENINRRFKFKTTLAPYDSSLKEGDKLYFCIEVTEQRGSEYKWYRIEVGNGYEFEFNVTYTAKHDPVYVDVIDPKVLLQNLVDRITGEPGRYTTDIEEFNESSNDLIMMAAAESIRSFDEAKVHTSYEQFMKWMDAYGYEQFVDENTLLFRKRAKGFRADLTAIELDQTECAGLRTYVNTDYLFSGLKVGYNRKDIENTNVRFEFNGVQEYTTDLDIWENVLEKISPYRADCYGIEFLAQERGKDTTDNKADKDLFLVNLEFGGFDYRIKRNKFTGNLPLGENENSGLFNGDLSPYYLMKIHSDLLGVSANKLEFTGSDSNSEIIIDGQSVNENFSIPPEIGLFDPIMYDIASKNIKSFPKGDLVDGVVRFNFHGNIYEGYINQISRNPAWTTETTWILHKKREI